MNTDQMTPVVRRWLRHTEATPPDARESARQVMARMPYVRQRGRWLPFPLFHRKARTAPATDTTEYQPSPVPATISHAPTVIGRTQTMFSPVKAITAGALIFALGGVLLIAQPFDQQGSVPGAEQGAEPPAPVFVAGKYVGGGGDDGEDHPSEQYGPAWLTLWTGTVQHEWTDPRLQGTETYAKNCIDYDDDSELTICRSIHNIVTDDGAWQMRPVYEVDGSDPSGSGGGASNFQAGSAGVWVLDGEGDYEGLSVVLAKDGLGFGGFIVPTEVVPPVPEGASTK